MTTRRTEQFDFREDGTIQVVAKKDPDADGAEDAVSTGRVERRTSPRIYDSFPARVRGKDSSGERFEIDTELDNLGFRGLYVRIARNIQPGAHVSVEVRLSSNKHDSVFAPRMALNGEVLRIEPRTDGSYGVAIEFHQRRFL